MIVDCHVHLCATTPGQGVVSDGLRRSLLFRFMRWRLGLKSVDDQALEREIEAKLASTIEETTEVDAAVILAFDAVHDQDGRLDLEHTHLYVTNDYAAEVVGRHPKMLFGASIHPYRKDAVAELERCIGLGAVLLKWLPVVQDFNPADARCFPFYEALAHHRLPLLSHTGGERSLPYREFAYADPELLVPALERGVTVIAAHCGTRALRGETDYLPSFLRMARVYERLYGDTSALNLPTRSYAYGPILDDPVVRTKLVHGSDWPIISIPPATQLGWRKALHLFSDRNWMRRDVAIKQQLGFDDAYWHRAATLLRCEGKASRNGARPAAGPV